MRFDDRVVTLLDWEARAAGDRARIWRQLIDLLGRATSCDHGLIASAVDRLIETEQDVALDDRRRLIEGIDLAAAPSALRAYLARDEAGCGDLLPAETPIDDQSASDMLNFGDDPDDFCPQEPPAPASQITDLLARIDAFHARRDDERAGGFSFEIDAAGALRAGGAGVPLASCAEPPQGVDGHAAGAWRSGTHFADARLSVERGPYAGEWRISADPHHDQAGRTIGYRGLARAPRADETAVLAAPPEIVPRVDVSRLDAAIDGLRETLEAMVDATDPEALPPGEIRIAAGEVATRSAALSAAMDTLELAVAAAGDGGLDMAALLVRIDGALQPMAKARGLKISFRIARGLPPVDADPQAVERMVTRLIGAVVALGWRGEHIVARLGLDRADGRMIALSLTRPGRFTGWPPQALLDSPALQEAEAPELGLGFALRLVDRLAQEAAGRLVIHDDRIVLSLPLPATPRVLRWRWS